MDVKFFGWDLTELEKEYYKSKEMIIYGAGNGGKHAYFILKNGGFKDNVIAFCDSNPKLHDTEIDGLKVIGPFQLSQHPDAIIIICSEQYGQEIYLQLARSGVSQQNLFYPPYQRLTAGCNRQYFDVFEAGTDEVFIDAGCYDGTTSIDFIKWCNGNYEKIYAFEPQKDMENICKNTFSKNNVTQYELIDKATWNDQGQVCFSDDFQTIIFGGACVVENSNNVIKTTTIDHVLAGQKATFIKMDVEGSELQALEGARETITKWRPKLAISLYHKPEDVITISSYILELIPEYKLYIRHYSSDIWETVLYAE